MAKSPKLDPQKVIVLCGVFAVSNMGMDRPDAEKLSRAIKSGTMSLESSVMYFAEQYMETDEHERIFNAEGRMWKKILSKLTEDEFRTGPWKDLAKAYDEAEKLAKA